MRFFTLYLDALASPQLFFKKLRQKKEQAGFLPGVVAIVGSIVAFVAALLVATKAHGTAGKTLFSNLSVVFVLLALLSLVYKSALFHLFAGPLGGTGDARALLSSMLYTYLPFAMLLPIALLLRFLRMDPFFILFFLSACIYSYKMEIAILGEVYSLGRTRSFVLFFVPFLVQLIFMLVVVLGFFSVIIGIFLKGFGVF